MGTGLERQAEKKKRSTDNDFGKMLFGTNRSLKFGDDLSFLDRPPCGNLLS